MWLDHLQHYVRSALQRTVRWPRLEDVYSEQRYRTVVRESIDRHVAELHAKNQADATPIDSKTPGVGLLTQLQRIGAEPEAKRRVLVRTWLSTQDRSFLRRAFLHAMDIVAPEPLGLAPLLDSILRAEITRRPLESAPDAPSYELAARLAEFEWSLHDDPALYAEEVRLVVDGVGTELGRAFVRLSGRAAVVFLLVVESLQSAGPPDEWRVSVPTLEYVLARPITHWDPDEPDDEFAHSFVAVRRLERLGLLTTSDREEGYGYFLSDHGAAVIREALQPDTAYRAIVGAFIKRDSVAALEARDVDLDGARQAASWVIETMAHGLRNALGPVTMAAERLETQVGTDASKQAVGTVRAGVRRAHRLLDDLVNLHQSSRAPAEPFDLGPALRDAAAIANGGEIEVDVGHVDGLVLHGPRLRLVHAVVELLRNARQHPRSGAPPRASISASRRPGAVEINIDDDGVGIPVEHRASIFRPGFSTRPGGTGRGLSLALEVIRSVFAGALDATDGPLGGARFVVTIPISEETS